MHLNPTWRAGNCLPAIFSSPAFHKTHSNHTHLCQTIDCLEALVDWLGQQLRELLIIEDFQVASGRNFAHCWRMPSVSSITIWTLNKYTTIAETLCKYLSSNVIQPHAFSNVASSCFHGWVTVDVREYSEAESVSARGICETVNGYTWCSSIEWFPHAVVHFVVRYGTPVLRLLVLYRLCIWETRKNETRLFRLIIHGGKPMYIDFYILDLVTWCILTGWMYY